MVELILFGEHSLSFAPPSLGIETVGGIMKPIIKHGPVIQAKESQTFTTCQDQQTTVYQV